MKNILGLKIDMERDWKILCASFLALVFVFLVADIFLFYGGYGSGGGTAQGILDITLTLDPVKLNQVVGDWKSREVSYNKLLKEREAVFDPSR